MSTSRPFVQYGLDTSKKPHAIQLLTLFAQTNSPSAAPGSAKSPSAAAGDSGTLNVEIYQQDGDYIKDIEVNDLRNRYTLTKGSTQKMVNTHSCTPWPTDASRPSLPSLLHTRTHPQLLMGLCQTFEEKCYAHV